jgi:UDP-N-acetylglucosamine--dolichyl-phosphate N-acetylglucosaminephosphotransferase
MIFELLLSLFGFFLALILCYFIMPFVIKSAKEAQMVTVDAHKPGKPEITEPGGLGALLSFTGAFLFVVLFFVSLYNIESDYNISEYLTFLKNPEFQAMIKNLFDNKVFLLGAILTVVIAGLLGFLDDIFGITFKWRHKILLGFLPSIPLMILKVGIPNVNLPFIGNVPFGVWYALLIVPLATNFGFNSVNMLAGYNGLETGMGIVSFITVFLTAFYVNDATIMLFSATMLGALLILFRYNKYPAKTLIGDSGTLMMGTALIVALVLANMEKLAVGIFLLYLINFLLFFVYLQTKQTKKLADIEISSNGKIYLRPPCPYSVYWFLPYYRNITEKQNVYILIGMQIVICFVTFILFILTS